MPLANSFEPWQVQHADTESGDAEEIGGIEENGGSTEREHEIELQEGEHWSNVSQSVKDLLVDMLHLSPQRRPLASHLRNHLWLNPASHQHPSNHVQNRCNITQNRESVIVPGFQSKSDINANEKLHLKGTVAATFRAIAVSPKAAHLGPVGMSELARRRFKNKGTVRE
ncbi:hypothetical protein PPYR_03952 [Photinus pyralis]|uniref:Protein kinase domain-containing protein n=1 Tax=Photinus pyralis TaxID=7054 RepID=A0A5N4AWS5_PHOPY|nr:hypothetical protein PPYR_03952 [Photinus pyralis]